VVLAVAFQKRVQRIVGVSVINARRKSAERLVTESGGVQQRRNQRAGAFSPVVVTAFNATTSSDVNERARR
jgi:hypothetical protein